MNILVTGANGQLGCEMRRLGAVSPNNYIFTDVAELDITNADAVMYVAKHYSIDAIVNCAAYTNVDKAESDEAVAELINATAVANLARAMKEVDGTLFHISTDYVFGCEGNTPRTEDMPLDPLGVYGRTKLHGEQAILDSGCKALIFRTSWLYSEFGNNFLKTMLRLTAEKETLNVVFDQVGTPTYAGKMDVSIRNSKLLLINEVNMEEYLRKVVPSEMPTSWHMEALKSQAVAARTYAYREIYNKKLLWIQRQLLMAQPTV